MTQRHSIIIPKTAAYYTIGSLSTAKTIWIVLHGYGYLAENFIKKFESIIHLESCVVAPEALSRFYLKGFNGKIGATWMTKHQREDEIKDYVNYLDSLYQVILAENQNCCTKINIVGFSQGGAVACRWFTQKKPSCTNLILWASVLPEDTILDLKNSSTMVTFVYGNNDEFLTIDRINQFKATLETATTKYKTIEFAGNHDIPETVLRTESNRNNWL